MGKVAEKSEPVWKITFSIEQLENKACPNLKKFNYIKYSNFHDARII
jgi:hypothetical protein